MKVSWSILRIASAIVFAVVLFITILFAEGYQFDSGNRDIVKKSVVFFEKLPEGADVYWDGQRVSFVVPGEIRASPGEHRVKIQREGYATWEKKIELQEDQVIRFPEIRLFQPEANLSEIAAMRNLETASFFQPQSFSEKGVLLLNPGLHFVKYYKLQSPPDFWVKDVTFDFRFNNLIQATEDVFIGLTQDGSLFAHKINKAKTWFYGERRWTALKTVQNKIFGLDGEGKIRLLKVDMFPQGVVGFLDEFYLGLPFAIASFDGIQMNKDYFLFILGTKEGRVLALTKPDGVIFFQEGGVDGAFLEENRVYFEKDGWLFIFDIKEKRVVSKHQLSQGVKWLSRIGNTFHFLFLADDNELRICDEDFENCAGGWKIQNSSIAASEDQTVFFTVYGDHFVMFDFENSEIGQSGSDLPQFLQDLVSGIFLKTGG